MTVLNYSQFSAGWAVVAVGISSDIENGGDKSQALFL